MCRTLAFIAGLLAATDIISDHWNNRWVAVGEREGRNRAITRS